MMQEITRSAAIFGACGLISTKTKTKQSKQNKNRMSLKFCAKELATKYTAMGQKKKTVVSVFVAKAAFGTHSGLWLRTDDNPCHDAFIGTELEPVDLVRELEQAEGYGQWFDASVE